MPAFLSTVALRAGSVPAQGHAGCCRMFSRSLPPSAYEVPGTPLPPYIHDSRKCLQTLPADSYEAKSQPLIYTASSCTKENKCIMLTTTIPVKVRVQDPVFSTWLQMWPAWHPGLSSSQRARRHRKENRTDTLVLLSFRSPWNGNWRLF